MIIIIITISQEIYYCSIFRYVIVCFRYRKGTYSDITSGYKLIHDFDI